MPTTQHASARRRPRPDRNDRPIIQVADPSRIQKIVDRYFKGKVIEGVTDKEGQPIPLPRSVVMEGWAEDIDEALEAIIEDCCAVGEERIRRALELNGGTSVEHLDASVIILPPLPGTLRVLRSDMTRRG